MNSPIMCESSQQDPVQKLADLIALCQRKKLMTCLANALAIKRQTVYLWRDVDNLSERNAKTRLWEISQLQEEKLSPLMTVSKLAELLEVVKAARVVVKKMSAQEG